MRVAARWYDIGVIGIFDSGLGGLSVWREIVRLMPEESIIYLADQAHVPYGSRDLLEVRALTVRAAQWLLDRRCTIIVLACNTASAAALHHLRDLHPEAQFVGMEPAVKPAASHTHTGAIGVLATPATFQSELYASVVARYAGSVRVIKQPCSGWVELVEAGCITRELDEQECNRAAAERVTQCVTPLLEAGVDTLVLGCTHFPFLEPLIRDVVEEWRAARGDAQPVEIIDPSPAVARQVARVRDEAGVKTAPAARGLREFWTTGAPQHFADVARQLLPELGGVTVSQSVIPLALEPTTCG